MARKSKCPLCYGTGRNHKGGPCSTCRGTGVIGAAGRVGTGILRLVLILIALGAIAVIVSVIAQMN